MKIATTFSSAPVGAAAPVSRTGTGTGQGRKAATNLPVAARVVVTPAYASAAFLAQFIAQEIMGEGLPRQASLADAYRPKPSATFEGLNFRALA